jgi:hypothetical protein
MREVIVDRGAWIAVFHRKERKELIWLMLISCVAYESPVIAVCVM